MRPKVPLIKVKFCEVCGRATVHRRRIVPTEEIVPERLKSYPVMGRKAILPMRCVEHRDPDAPVGPED